MIIAALILVFQAISFLVQKYFEVNINSGFIFGLFGNNLLSIFFSVIILFSIIILENKQIISTNSFILITAGSISNIVDRLIYGGSVDYISILQYPSFNLADILIMTGCLIFARDMIKSSIYKKT
ncbi:MAG: signal peptidase II [Patescibacteria group bacterium]